MDANRGRSWTFPSDKLTSIASMDARARTVTDPCPVVYIFRAPVVPIIMPPVGKSGAGTCICSSLSDISQGSRSVVVAATAINAARPSVHPSSVSSSRTFVVAEFVGGTPSLVASTDAAIGRVVMGCHFASSVA